MAITSIRIGGLEVNDGFVYAVATSTHYALVTTAPEEPKIVEMADRYPAYVGSKTQARQIPLLLMLLSKTVSQRIADYNMLVSACSMAAGLVSLEWTDEGVTRRYLVHVAQIAPNAWFSRAAASLTAPNPYAEVV